MHNNDGRSRPISADTPSLRKVLVTGGTGFIGRQLLQKLKEERDLSLHLALRNPLIKNIRGTTQHVVGPFDGETDFQDALRGADIVLHLAGRAHQLRDASRDPLAEFRQINVAATTKLARQAAEQGVKRFVFISSIGVNGASTDRTPFAEGSPPAPAAAYAISKLEAEQALRKTLAETATELVIIRPPLVYGSNAPGNFGRLLRLVQKGLPLPLSLVNNQRSLVAVENLIDFIWLCALHPHAAGEVFLVSDGKDLSTPELLRQLALGMGKTARLWPVPPRVLELGATLLGQRHAHQQLCGNLQVDITKARRLLNWKPRIDVEEALRRTAEAFLQGKDKP